MPDLGKRHEAGGSGGHHGVHFKWRKGGEIERVPYFHAISTRSGVTLAALELPLLQKVPEKVSMRDIFPPALISVKASVCVKV